MSRLVLVVLACLALVSAVAGRPSLGQLEPAASAALVESSSVSSTPEVDEFEGQPCSFQSLTGTCTSGSCFGGRKISGKCAGPAEVLCCIKGSSFVPQVSAPTPAAALPVLGRACGHEGQGICLTTATACTSGRGATGRFVQVNACANAVCCMPAGSARPPAAESAVGKTCFSGSLAGKCLTSNVACNGLRIPGKCPGPASITCCIPSNARPTVFSNRNAASAAAAAATPAVEGEGALCQYKGFTGLCTAKPCRGMQSRVSGQCPGGQSVNCCVNMSGPKPVAPATLALGGTMGASFNVPATGEGSQCQYKGFTGMCTSKPCTGGQSTRVSGQCGADRSVACCVAMYGPSMPVAPAKPVPVLPAKPLEPKPEKPEEHKPLPINMVAPFNYRFPYSAVRHIVADFTLQRIRLYDGAVALKEWKMSSGIAGIGFKEDYPATPAGKFKVAMKVGYDQPIGMTFEALTPMKYIGKETDPSAHMQTRILVLDGLDTLNANSKLRGIMVHGTNRERNLGKMDSHGCFRMGNLDIIELFDNIRTGIEMWAAPKDAWPKTSVPTGVIPALPPA